MDLCQEPLPEQALYLPGTVGAVLGYVAVHILWSRRPMARRAITSLLQSVVFKRCAKQVTAEKMDTSPIWIIRSLSMTRALWKSQMQAFNF